ncbi:MAG: three-Cys-motif partner protein TcmP [Desulfitobacteriaceae bacterium]|nr:three-Cys-motif partner protein TcmP [Desulfitobacteriaceae bacterium]
MQSFGGTWTLLKLEVLEKYLNFYVKALKNKPFKLCYIDAFAGSGNVDVKGIGKIPGSAVRAIYYPFDRYIFFEKNVEYAKELRQRIIQIDKTKKIQILTGDCNELLRTIESIDWYKNYWRGVIFLDPYAMQLKWSSLKIIKETGIFDVWYLFPLSALNRVLQRDGKIPEKNKIIINNILGTVDWEKEFYFQSSQMTLFGEPDIERKSIDHIGKYVIRRLKTIFPAVSDKSLVLRNQNNSPLFLLCFAVSNSNKTAIETSLKAADHILTHT